LAGRNRKMGKGTRGDGDKKVFSSRKGGGVGRRKRMTKLDLFSGPIIENEGTSLLGKTGEGNPR